MAWTPVQVQEVLQAYIEAEVLYRHKPCGVLNVVQESGRRDLHKAKMKFNKFLTWKHNFTLQANAGEFAPGSGP